MLHASEKNVNRVIQLSVIKADIYNRKEAEILLFHRNARRNGFRDAGNYQHTGHARITMEGQL